MGIARLGESDLHPISPKTPSLQYQQIERIFEEKGKTVETKRGRAARPINSISPACSQNTSVQHHRIQGQQDCSTETLRGE